MDALHAVSAALLSTSATGDMHQAGSTKRSKGHSKSQRNSSNSSNSNSTNGLANNMQQLCGGSQQSGERRGIRDMSNDLDARSGGASSSSRGGGASGTGTAGYIAAAAHESRKCYNSSTTCKRNESSCSFNSYEGASSSSSSGGSGGLDDPSRRLSKRLRGEAPPVLPVPHSLQLLPYALMRKMGAKSKSCAALQGDDDGDCDGDDDDMDEDDDVCKKVGNDSGAGSESTGDAATDTSGSSDDGAIRCGGGGGDGSSTSGGGGASASASNASSCGKVIDLTGDSCVAVSKELAVADSSGEPAHAAQSSDEEDEDDIHYDDDDDEEEDEEEDQDNEGHDTEGKEEGSSEDDHDTQIDEGDDDSRNNNTEYRFDIDSSDDDDDAEDDESDSGTDARNGKADRHGSKRLVPDDFMRQIMPEVSSSSIAFGGASSSSAAAASAAASSAQSQQQPPPGQGPRNFKITGRSNSTVSGHGSGSSSSGGGSSSSSSSVKVTVSASGDRTFTIDDGVSRDSGVVVGGGGGGSSAYGNNSNGSATGQADEDAARNGFENEQGLQAFGRVQQTPPPPPPPLRQRTKNRGPSNAWRVRCTPDDQLPPIKLPAGIEDIDKGPTAMGREVMELPPGYMSNLYSWLQQLELRYFDHPPLHGEPHLPCSKDTRGRAINWMMGICDRSDVDPEALFLAVHLLDKALLRVPQMTKRDMEKLVTVCLTVSTKFLCEEHVGPQEMSDQWDGVYSKQELILSELYLLKLLDHRVMYPTTYQFTMRYCRVVGITEEKTPKAYHMVQYLMELSLLNYAFVPMRQSLKAAAAVNLVSQMLRLRSWDAHCKYYTSYSALDLQDCVKLLHATMIVAEDRSDAREVFERYNCKKKSFAALGPICGARELSFDTDTYLAPP